MQKTTDDIGNYIYVLADYCFPTMSWDCLIYYLIFKWWLRPSAFFDRTNINIWQRLNILCIMFKIITVYIITSFVRLYDILLTSGKHVAWLHQFTKRWGWVHSSSLTLPLLLTCLYQAKKVVSHVFCVSVIDLPLSMIFLLDYGTVSTLWYLILTIHSIIQVTSLYGRVRTTHVLYLVGVLA